jgi:hypothetical protein
LAHPAKRLASAVKCRQSPKAILIPLQNDIHLSLRKGDIMKRYYLRDTRQQSMWGGKPEGGWLKTPPTPARWVTRREHAQAFTVEEINALKTLWHYLEGCEIVAVDSSGVES